MYYKKLALVVFLLMPLVSFGETSENVALMDALVKDDLKGVEEAIAAGANPSLMDGKSSVLETAVMAATLVNMEDQEEKSNLYKIVATLVKSGALEHQVASVMHWPILREETILLSFLIDHGADITAKIDDLSPAEAAIKYGKDKSYATLIKAGAVPVPAHMIPCYRLIGAASEYSVEEIKKQIEAGADINWEDPNGHTPILAAVSLFGGDAQYQSVEWLLNNGANPNLIPSQGGLPIHVVIEHGSVGLEKGSDEKYNEYAATLVSNAVKLVKLLLSKGAKVSGSDENGNTPLHLAAKHNFLDVAKLLIKEGAKINQLNEYSKTPFDLAEGKEILQLLRANGARD